MRVRRSRNFLLTLALGGAVAAIAAPVRAQDPPPPAADARPGASAAGVSVDSIVVRGNQRIEEAVVRVNSALQPGPGVTARDVQEAIRRLMATGNFSDVQVLSEGDPAAGGVNLIIEVEERPLIARYEFRGLERASPKAVRDTLGLQENQPLNPNLVLQAERMIRDLLTKEGVQLVSVDTTLTPVTEPAGAYQLTFRVREGNRLSVADIDFVGNEAFDDGALKDAIETSEEGFLWFHTGKFDRQVFQEDLRDRLPTFYGSRGYIDFAVVSDTLVVDPQTGKARLLVEVSEGPQYRLGEFSIAGASRFPEEQLRQIFTAQRRSVLGLPFGGAGEREQGEVFDRAALDQATERVQQMYRNEGYLYAQVVPRVERVETPEGGAPRVNVTWAVSEQQPFYINMVRVAGNTYTHETVIRERLMVYPGDVYNEDRLLQSYRSIAALGFFENPLPTPDILPNPEAGTVDIVFHVKEKQTGSVQFGTAIGGGYYGQSGGISGFLGYSQPNLFGQAKQADLRAEYGYGRSSFQASYTDPALFGTRNSASASVFHTDDRYRGFSFTDGRQVRTGASLRYGFPVFGLSWTRAFLGYSLSRLNYQARDAEDCDPGNIFCQPSAIASNLSLALTRDTKNHPLFPTAGTRQNVTVEQVGGPLGGDGNFRKLTGDAEWWVPVGQLGGGAPGSRPIVMTFGLQARGGAVFGDAGRFPLQRFFLGGTQWGQALRGYEESTLTPFGYFERQSGVVSSAQRLGDAFFTMTGEYAIRFNDNLSLSLFGDAGNIWSEPGSVNPTQLFRSLGIGATIVTPFGPLGLDYAYGFDKTQPGFQFHFKINQPGF